MVLPTMGQVQPVLGKVVRPNTTHNLVNRSLPVIIEWTNDKGDSTGRAHRRLDGKDSLGRVVVFAKKGNEMPSILKELGM